MLIERGNLVPKETKETDPEMSGCKDKIFENKIILDGRGTFPKKVIINEDGKLKEYRLIRSQYGKYSLNK